jgi:hypothetical protein
LAHRIEWEKFHADGSSTSAAVDWARATEATGLVESAAQDGAGFGHAGADCLLAAEGLSNTAIAQQVSTTL